NSAYGFLRPQRGIVCCAQWHVIGQPDIEVKPILNIIREKLRFEPGTDKTTEQQEKRGNDENRPAMPNRRTHETVIETVETTLAFLLQRGLSPGRRSLNVVSEQWNECHCNDQRTEQRRRHNNRETVQELPSVAMQHEEWKVGDDVRRGCE